MSYEVRSSSCADRCEVTDFQHIKSIATFGPWSFTHFWIIFFMAVARDLTSLPECCISPSSNQYFCLKASGWSCIQPSPLYLAGISWCSWLGFSCKPLQDETAIISVTRHTNLSETNWVSLWGYNIKLPSVSPLTPQMIVWLQIHAFIISVFHLLFSSNSNPLYTASLLPQKVINSLTELFNQAKYWLAWSLACNFCSPYTPKLPIWIYMSTDPFWPFNWKPAGRLYVNIISCLKSGLDYTKTYEILSSVFCWQVYTLARLFSARINLCP